VVYCAERFNCNVNDLIYGRLSIIISSYVRNSVDETTLDPWLSRGSLLFCVTVHLTIADLLSSDELIKRRFFARLHELVGFLVCLLSCCILYSVYDLIINNNIN